MAKRNDLEIAEDNASIAKLLALGYRSPTAIANVVNEKRPERRHINPKMVSNAISKLHEEYAIQGIEDYNVYRNKILDEISVLQVAYWEAYEKSRRNKLSFESESVMDTDEYLEAMEAQEHLEDEELEAREILQRNVRIREEQRLEGNPRFLDGVLACVDRKAKIYGIDAPSKVALTDSTGSKSAVDVLELIQQKMSQLSNNLTSEETNEDFVEGKLLEE